MINSLCGRGRGAGDQCWLLMAGGGQPAAGGYCLASAGCQRCHLRTPLPPCLLSPCSQHPDREVGGRAQQPAPLASLCLFLVLFFLFRHFFLTCRWMPRPCPAARGAAVLGPVHAEAACACTADGPAATMPLATTTPNAPPGLCVMCSFVAPCFMFTPMPAVQELARMQEGSWRVGRRSARPGG